MICFIPTTLGAKYEIRVDHLKPDYAIQFTCFFCDHVSIMSASFFKSKYPPYQRIVELEPKFKCGECQNKISNGWQIVRRVTQSEPDQERAGDVIPFKKSGSRS